MRTIDGVTKKGFCRYPRSLLRGKNYKKSKKRMTPAQILAFVEMSLKGATAQANIRRSKTMKLKNKSKKEV